MRTFFKKIIVEIQNFQFLKCLRVNFYIIQSSLAENKLFNQKHILHINIKIGI